MRHPRDADAQRHGRSGAKFLAESLVQTSLRGYDTRGVAIFPYYLKEIDGGRSVVKPRYRTIKNEGATMLIDAGASLGILAERFGSEEAIKLANKFGVDVVVVRNSNRFGVGD